MPFPATPGWVSLPVVVRAPRHSWLRAPGAVPRHSWLGSAGGGGVWLLATPGCGSRSRFPATPGWGVCWWRCWAGACHSWLRVRGGGSPSLLAGVRRPWRWVFPRVGVSRVVCACGVACACSACAGVSVLVVVRVWARLSRAFVCVCVCACVLCWWRAVWCHVVCWWGSGWCVLWLVPRHSWRRFLCATPRHSWLGFAAGGGGCSSPLLAEGPGCGSPPLLAGVRWRRWCVVACHSWLRVPVAVPRRSWLGGPLVVLGGPLPLLAVGLGGGSPLLLARVRRPGRWVFPRVGVSRVVCAWV